MNLDSIQNPIIVEGKKDVESLRNLGIKGIISSLNGRSINDLVDQFRNFSKIIILTDYDSEGVKIKNKLVRNLQLEGIKTELSYYNILRKILKGGVLQVEGLFNFIKNKGWI
jgi:2,5-diamino-6-(ribosylamino)-4(3H)-pyrimidinone 5'-phosphate reductase